MFEIKSILEWVGTVERIRSVFASEISVQLQKLGDLEYSAAIKAFRDMELSHSPEREWIMGVTCLRQALEKFAEASHAGSMRRQLDMLLSVFTLGMREPPYEKAAERSVITALTIATAYHVEGNSLLIERYSIRTMELFDSYRSRYVEDRYREGAGSGMVMQAEERRKKYDAEMSVLRKRLENICTMLQS